MRERLLNLYNNLKFYLGFMQSSPVIIEYNLLDLIVEAKQEWENAENIFKEVTDSDLVEYAIYRAKAAEKRYMYLLKEAEKEALSNQEIPIIW